MTNSWNTNVWNLNSWKTNIKIYKIYKYKTTCSRYISKTCQESGGLDYFYKTCFFPFYSLYCSPLDILILNIFEFARNHLVFSSGKYSFVVFQQFENILVAKNSFLLKILLGKWSNLYFVYWEQTKS